MKGLLQSYNYLLVVCLSIVFIPFIVSNALAFEPAAVEITNQSAQIFRGLKLVSADDESIAFEASLPEGGLVPGVGVVIDVVEIGNPALIVTFESDGSDRLEAGIHSMNIGTVNVPEGGCTSIHVTENDTNDLAVVLGPDDGRCDFVKEFSQ